MKVCNWSPRKCVETERQALSSFFEISSIGFNLLPPGFASHPEIFEGNRLLLLLLLCDLNRKIVQFCLILKET